MDDHLAAAQYHREQAHHESDRQGSGEFRIDDSASYAASRLKEVFHQNAAMAAEAIYAAETGQEVSWDHGLNPHFSPK
jgi:hypothetical protein